MPFIPEFSTSVYIFGCFDRCVQAYDQAVHPSSQQQVLLHNHRGGGGGGGGGGGHHSQAAGGSTADSEVGLLRGGGGNNASSASCSSSEHLYVRSTAAGEQVRMQNHVRKPKFDIRFSHRALLPLHSCWIPTSSLRRRSKDVSCGEPFPEINTGNPRPPPLTCQFWTHECSEPEMIFPASRFPLMTVYSRNYICN